MKKINAFLKKSVKCELVPVHINARISCLPIISTAEIKDLFAILPFLFKQNGENNFSRHKTSYMQLTQLMTLQL